MGSPWDYQGSFLHFYFLAYVAFQLSLSSTTLDCLTLCVKLSSLETRFAAHHACDKKGPRTRRSRDEKIGLFVRKNQRLRKWQNLPWGLHSQRHMQIEHFVGY